MALKKIKSTAPKGKNNKVGKIPDKSQKPKAKFSIFGKNLLLKQTVLSTWKSKLQLVILLLLSSFATALITGTFVSYERIVSGANFLGLNNAQFDAVLPYPASGVPINEIADQAFSLHTGRLYYQQNASDAPLARYYDDTIIGQQTDPLKVSDFNIKYQRTDNKITGIENMDWANDHPITFNLKDKYVQASIYGQLKIKANNSTGALQDHYEAAAQEMYDRLFLQVTAPQMLNSLKDYFVQWINLAQLHPSQPSDNNPITKSDVDFTNWMLNNKINYRGTGVNDLTIPFSVNLGDKSSSSIASDVLNHKLVKKTDPNPRVTYDVQNYGLNGQWMRIFRTFDYNAQTPDSVIKDFINNYSSPSNYNQVSDDKGSESVYSSVYALGAAALQNRDIKVINQFTGTAFVKNIDGKSVDFDVRVIDLGLKNQYNHPDVKIFEGVYPTSRNEIVISPQYARVNGIKPGDSVTVNNRNFIVSGIGGDAFNIYPTFNPTDAVPNTRSQFLIYVYPDSFNDNSWFDDKNKTDTSLMYFLPWQNAPPASGFNVSEFDDFFQKTMFSTNGINDSSQYDYSNYLIKKYVDKQQYTSQYNLTPNLVAVKGTAQFLAYNQGASTYNAILSGFKWAGIVGVVFITLIVCFITYLIVKKAIQKAQVSTGILKSSGYTTWKVAASYLAYPLIALIIAIPVGWFAGLALQVYFTEIFNTLFVLPYNVFDFNVIPALISIAVIIGFIFATSLLTAYRMLQTPPLLLIKKDSDISVGNKHKLGWLQSKIKNSFKFKFLLSLSKTSWRKILVTGTVIGLATLAITSTVSVPATISNMKATYFKSQKYQNFYQYQDPIPNMPLSKYGLYAWNNLENPNNELYYPVAGVMPWPEDIIIKDNNNNPVAYYNPLDYKITSFDPLNPNLPKTNNLTTIMKFYGTPDDVTKNKIIDYVSASLIKKGTNGPLSPDLITWNYSWLGGRAFSNQLIKDLAKQDKTPGQAYSAALIDLAAKLLPSVIGVSNTSGATGINAISEILKQTLPGFIRQSLDQKARDNPNIDPYQYFSIGHNTVSYDPTYSKDVNGPGEELVTQFQLGSDNPTLVNKGFLSVVGIDPNTNMLTMNKNLVNQLKYSDSQTEIPMVINRAFAAQYRLNVGDQFSGAPDVNTLYYKDTSNNYKPIPKADWYYGTNPDSQTPDSADKNVWNRSANKWNARGDFPIEAGEGQPSQYKDTYGYNYNGIYDKNGKPVASKDPQQWNDTNQLWLKLPSDINSLAKSGWIKNSDGTHFNFTDLSKIASPSGQWIKPFSFDFTLPAGEKVEPTSLLTSRLAEWYGGMLDQGILKTAPTLEGKEGIKAAIQNKMPDWWAGMTGNRDPIHKYRIIGIQDSYDTARAFVDQKWANSILGYSYVNDQGTDKDPTYGPGIYQWFSGKMSSYEDIYDVIGRLSVSFSSDDYTMYGVNGINGNQQQSIIKNADLLSRKKQMFDKMTGIAFSASAIFIITTVLCSILIVIMITDLFTDQFRRFMALMKSEGYSNWEINSFTLGIFTPWVIFGYIAGFGFGILTVYSFIKILQVAMNIVLPFSFIWWLIPFSLLIIGGIYISTFIINNRQLSKMNLIDLLKTNE